MGTAVLSHGSDGRGELLFDLTEDELRLARSLHGDAGASQRDARDGKTVSVFATGEANACAMAVDASASDQVEVATQAPLGAESTCKMYRVRVEWEGDTAVVTLRDSGSATTIRNSGQLTRN